MLANPLTVPSGHQSTDWPKSRKLLFGICLVLFLYQLYRITAQYYKYETKFEIRSYGHDGGVLDLPAVTLCTPRDLVFLTSTLKKKYPDLWSRIESLIKGNDTDKWKDIDGSLHYYTRTHQTHELWFEKSLKYTDISGCLVPKTTLYMKAKNSNFDRNECSTLSPVLESRVATFGKCFTFLSRQQKEINAVTDLQVETKPGSASKTSSVPVPISVRARHRFAPAVMLGVTADVHDQVIKTEADVRNEQYLIHDPDYSRDILMYVHDPYRMPSFDRNDAFELKPGKAYDIRFWTETKTLLKHPYNRCKEYRKNVKTSAAKSWDQCVRNCFVDKSWATSGCLPLSSVMANDEKFRSHGTGSCNLVQELNVRPLTTEDQCKELCERDCTQTEYHFDVRVRDRKDQKYTALAMPYRDDRPLSFNFSIVNIRPQLANDRHYREVPVQSMCSTVHQMMIALLVWFGLSVFSFSSIFETAVTKARPHMYLISSFEDRVTPNAQPLASDNKTEAMSGLVVSGGPDQAMIRPKFTATNIGSNVKLEHYNEFIAKVVDGYPNAPAVDLNIKKTQY